MRRPEWHRADAVGVKFMAIRLIDFNFMGFNVATIDANGGGAWELKSAGHLFVGDEDFVDFGGKAGDSEDVFHEFDGGRVRRAIGYVEDFGF